MPTSRSHVYDRDRILANLHDDAPPVIGLTGSAQIEVT